MNRNDPREFRPDQALRLAFHKEREPASAADFGTEPGPIVCPSALAWSEVRRGTREWSALELAHLLTCATCHGVARRLARPGFCAPVEELAPASLLERLLELLWERVIEVPASLSTLAESLLRRPSFARQVEAALAQGDEAATKLLARFGGWFPVGLTAPAAAAGFAVEAVPFSAEEFTIAGALRGMVYRDRRGEHRLQLIQDQDPGEARLFEVVIVDAAGETLLERMMLLCPDLDSWTAEAVLRGTLPGQTGFGLRVRPTSIAELADDQCELLQASFIRVSADTPSEGAEWRAWAGGVLAPGADMLAGEVREALHRIQKGSETEGPPVTGFRSRTVAKRARVASVTPSALRVGLRDAAPAAPPDPGSSHLQLAR